MNKNYNKIKFNYLQTTNQVNLKIQINITKKNYKKYNLIIYFLKIIEL